MRTVSYNQQLLTTALLTKNKSKYKHMTTVREKWTDYERVQIIRHHRTFGMANLHLLVKSISRHSHKSTELELSRFNKWIKTGVMDFGKKAKPGGRAGVVETYTRIIQTLGI